MSLLESEFVEVRPNRIVHVVKSKPQNTSSRVIFFVHGLGGRVEQWYTTMEYFANKYVDCMCVGYDWLGHGNSERPDDWQIYQWDELLADLHAVFDKYSCTSDNNYVLAHSFGSGLSMDFILRDGVSEKVKKLVLVGTAINGPPAASNKFLYAPNFFLEWTRKLVKEQFRKACYHQNTSEKIIEREEAAASKNPMYVIKYCLRQMKWPKESEIQRITTPTLVYTGTDDRVMPVDHGKAVSELISNSTFKLVENAAHAPMVEVPDESNQLIDEFLAFSSS